MRWAATAAFCWGAVVLELFAGDAGASTMGSLAPHDAAATSANQQGQQWIADPRTLCRALDSDFDPDDTIAWDGNCAAGFATGPGTLSFQNRGRTIETITGDFSAGVLQPGHVTAAWGNGSKYDGDQSGGQFDGIGLFNSATGDRLQGAWKAGALNGPASVVWANGDRYDGEWKNGKSDGAGTEIWANGDRYEGPWKDGKPLGKDAEANSAGHPVDSVGHDDTARTHSRVAAGGGGELEVRPAPARGVLSPTQPKMPQPLAVGSTTAVQSNAASVTAGLADPVAQGGQTDTDASPLRGLIGMKLVAVDGSSVDLSPSEDGFVRVVTLPTGVAQQTFFSFMNNRIGTVASESTAIGVFRTDPGELIIDYADGDIEVVKSGSGGGLLVTAHAPDGASSCTAWYPQGHIFSQAEKKAAVQEYAIRLGVAAPASTKKTRGTHPGSRICGGAYLVGVPDSRAAAAVGTGDAMQNAASPHLPASPPAQSVQTGIARARLTDASQGLQPVPVKPSMIHLIDSPNDPAVRQPSMEEAKFTVSGAIAAPLPMQAGPAEVPRHESSNASECLSVASNGEYWGFQNRCATAVQFAYCEMSESNPLTACHHTNVSGSVAANGFSTLVGDRSLTEQGIKHDFRWMACDGGAGEVVAHLDSVDPPVGRCLRAVDSAGR